MVLTLKVAIFACILALAMGSKHKIVNNEIDALLMNLNNLLASKKMDSSLLPDLRVDAAPVFVGTTVSDLTTMHRTGNCELWTDGDNLKFKMNVGLKNMTVQVSLVPYLEGPGNYSFDGASAEIGLTLKQSATESCSTDWDYLKITTLGIIQTHSFNKKYDGKPPPKEITKLLIPYYNKYLNGNEMFSIKNLNQLINVCDPLENSHF